MEKTGYELSRNFFDWSYENPDKIGPTHVALFFFAIEHCNRLGWKDKFGMPTQMAMDAIGVKNWRTYSKALNDLVEFGFFKIIERSKNQYSATVIAIVKNTKANTKAYTKATQKHVQKHSRSIAVIDKPINLLTYNYKDEEINLPFLNDEEFVKKWNEWVDYRTEIKKPYRSAKSIEEVFEKFKTWGRDRTISAIKYSMSQSYQGIFEERSNNGKHTENNSGQNQRTELDKERGQTSPRDLGSGAFRFGK